MRAWRTTFLVWSLDLRRTSHGASDPDAAELVRGRAGLLLGAALFGGFLVFHLFPHVRDYEGGRRTVALRKNPAGAFAPRYYELRAPPAVHRKEVI